MTIPKETPGRFLGENSEKSHVRIIHFFGEKSGRIPRKTLEEFIETYLEELLQVSLKKLLVETILEEFIQKHIWRNHCKFL